MEDLIKAFLASGSLDRHNVERLPHDTNNGAASAGIRRHVAGILIRQVEALTAELDAALEIVKRICQLADLVRRTAQEVKREALSSFWSNAGGGGPAR